MYCLFLILQQTCLSVAKITGNGVKVLFNGNECNLVGVNGEYIASAYKHINSNLYRLNAQPMYAMYVGNTDNIGNNQQQQQRQQH